MKEPYAATPEEIAEVKRIEAELDAAEAVPFTEERIQEILKYVRAEDERRKGVEQARRMLDMIMNYRVPTREENGKS